MDYQKPMWSVIMAHVNFNLNLHVPLLQVALCRHVEEHVVAVEAIVGSLPPTSG